MMGCAGAVWRCAVRRCGVELAGVTAGVRRVWGRAAVAFVVALAAACVSVPAAQAWSKTMEIGFQASSGDLWTWTIDNPGSNLGMGMMAGTSPSVAASAAGANHEIAFQANTGYLWTTGAGGHGSQSVWNDGGHQSEHRRFRDRVSGERRRPLDKQ